MADAILAAKSSFSSLYIGILAATFRLLTSTRLFSSFQFPLHRDPRCNTYDLSADAEVVGFSSLYIGILAATRERFLFIPNKQGFSSLYIGILAATVIMELRL